MSRTGFVLSCIQLNGAASVEENIPVLEAFVRRARDKGAEVIATPEVSDTMEPDKAAMLGKARTETEHPMLARALEWAKHTGVWISLGSLVIRREGVQPGEAPLANRQFLIAPSGEIVARYDKIHMFDVQVGDGQNYRESQSCEPGKRAVIADLPWGRLGLTICYDLRFAYLHRALAKAGADFLSVPAAFTKVTGQAHWRTLLCARAIETGCFVFASTQCGIHKQGRETYGHAIIIDPWGGVLAEGDDEPGLVTATIEPDLVAEARGKIPALSHDRAFDAPTALASATE